MATLEISLRDWLNDQPVPGAPLEAIAVVVANYKVTMLTPPPERPPTSGANTSEVFDASWSPDTQQVDKNDATRIQPTLTAITDAAGKASFYWDARRGSPLAVEYAKKLALDPQDGQTPSVFIAFLVATSFGSRVDYVIPTGTTGPFGHVSDVVHVDYGAAVVGSVTDRSAWLGFRSNAGSSPFGHGVTCQIFGPATSARRRTPLPVATVPLPLDPQLSDTGRVLIGGLSPLTPYTFRVRSDHPTRVLLASGSFRTAPGLVVRPRRPRAESTRIAFASCHDYVRADSCDDTDRWQALRTWNPDLVLLMGDQIYGDTTKVTRDRLNASTSHANGPIGAWFDFYAERYRAAWKARAVRGVLSNVSTLTVPDDHDVADDWGVDFDRTDPKHVDRITGALMAYHAFSPPSLPLPGSSAAMAADPLDRSFVQGHVAGYILDCRTQRGLDPASPVLGAAQSARFIQWCQGPARNSDVVVVVAPVPLVFADTNKIESAINNLPANTAVTGLAAGAAVGALAAAAFGGPAGWVYAGAVLGWGLGGVAGSYLQNDKFEFGEDGKVIEPDVKDHWTNGDNRKDLAVVVKELFDLANDVLGGGTRRRAVIVLSGDLHLGAFHQLTSDDPRHIGGKRIIQAVSSPISHSTAQTLVDNFWVPINAPWDLTTMGEVLRADHRLYRDPGTGFEFRGRILGDWLNERNFGTLVVDRPDRRRRRYEVRLNIRGTVEARTFEAAYDLDVSAAPRALNVQPTVDSWTPS